MLRPGGTRTPTCYPQIVRKALLTPHAPRLQSPSINSGFSAPTAIAELISAVAHEFPSRRHPALTDQSLHEGVGLDGACPWEVILEVLS